MSDDLYRGRHRAPAGRHRAVAAPAPRPAFSRTPRSSLPKLSRPGFLLPTAAATLALAATGAHLGGSLTATGLQQSAARNVTAGILPSGGATGDPIERLDQDRTSRSAPRSSGSATTDSATDALSDGVSADAAKAQADAAKAQADAAKAQADSEAEAVADAKATADAQAAATAQAAADAKAAAHAWVAPIGHDSGFQMTSGFGMRWGAMHPGQDFAVAVGTPVRALSSGTVIFAGWSGGYGNKLEIQYWDGTVSWFAHNSRLLVAQGETVTPGEQVSLSGNTGHSTGPHLHVEIHPGNGSPVSPVPWLTAKGIMP